ncbi:MAG: hypothetical protein PHQ56_02560 [Dysgonamonadaceae bacterium]|nr:hypothetical protein [Dysgonamonadaceae bacterium]MDD4605197.1 hypothetical protein [Dysgonamonadaceae bacterium]
MPFVKDVVTHKSISVVGLEKNTGKTETLNYVLKRLRTSQKQIAITSIGLDGERIDSVTQTQKPEIVVSKGVIFVTSEKHFFEKRLTAEILDVSNHRTAMGRLVIAKALSEGKVILSGPSDTVGVRKLISNLSKWDVDTTIVDGALSRLSLASPAVTDAMILATGAALSANIPQLVRKTLFVKQLIELEPVDAELSEQLQALKSGIWAIDKENRLHDLDIQSVFMIDKSERDIFEFGTRLYVAGAVSDKLINCLRTHKRPVELIIHDFSKVFASQLNFDAFLQGGNTMKSLFKNKLIAVTINPLAPNGLMLNTETLQKALEEELNIPVYDVMELQKNDSSLKFRE